MRIVIAEISTGSMTRFMATVTHTTVAWMEKWERSLVQGRHLVRTLKRI